jgi:hypothetical protein
MLRFWQAYVSVKDSQYSHPVQRTLTVLQPVVQVRLSILVVTIGTFLAAVVTAAIKRRSVPVDQGGQQLNPPTSLLGWMVQASREHSRDTQADISCSPAAYVSLHKDLELSIFTAPDGRGVIRIMDANELSFAVSENWDV